MLFTYQVAKCKIVLIAIYSWDNIPREFPGRWNVLLARIDHKMQYHDFLAIISRGNNRNQQLPDTFQSYSQLIESTL